MSERLTDQQLGKLAKAVGLKGDGYNIGQIIAKANANRRGLARLQRRLAGSAAPSGETPNHFADAARFQHALLECRSRVSARRQSVAIDEELAAKGRDNPMRARYFNFGAGLDYALQIIDLELSKLADTPFSSDTET